MIKPLGDKYYDKRGHLKHDPSGPKFKKRRKKLRKLITQRITAILVQVCGEENVSVLEDVYDNLDRDVQISFCKCPVAERRDLATFAGHKNHPRGHDEDCLYARYAK